jgi:rfaE bifunctional protein nucleotidyltransferase chain/domain
MITVKKKSLFKSDKIKLEDDIKNIIIENKKEGKSVGLCVGSYDLLHPGHIKHFDTAKHLCDVLIVAVTKDIYVRKRKGVNRPIFSEVLRAYSISSLSSVDYVLISRYERATKLIQFLQPSYYIKGIEYKNKTTSGITSEKEKIISVGGKIKYTSDEKLSSSEIINQINKKTKKAVLIIIFGPNSKLKEKLLTEFSRKNSYFYLDSGIIEEGLIKYNIYKNKTFKLLLKIANKNLKSHLNVLINYNDKFEIESVENLIRNFYKKFIVIKILIYDSDVNHELKSEYPGFDFAFQINERNSITVDAFKHKIMNFIFENENE